MEAFARRACLDWVALFANADANGVAPLVYYNIMRQLSLATQVPEDLRAQYRLYALRNFFQKKQGA